MSNTGIRTAKPPVSPHPNLAAVKRVDTTNCGSAIWKVVCTCGATLTADAPAIKRGAARCRTCNPSRGMAQANKILAVLPAAYAKIERKTGLTYAQVIYRIEWMRERDMCHVGDWDRADQQGSFSPIFHAGKGGDVPCDLKPRTRASSERRYKRRIKRAIQRAQAGGKEDPRYIRHIRLKQVDAKVKQAKAEPHTWISALM